jgi:Tol biopolymer transport system component
MKPSLWKYLSCIVVVVVFVMGSGTRCTIDPIPPVSNDTFLTILYPFFSYDGSKVFFFGHLRSSPEGDWLYEVDTAGGKARLVMRDSLKKSNPRLSPDGRKVAYQAAMQVRLLCCAHLWVMNIDGTNTRDYTPWGGYWEGHQWSPDGQKLVLFGPVEDRGTIHNQILLINADGTNPKLITQGDSGSGGPRWSSDGSQIFYVTKNSLDELSSEVYVMDPDGSNKKPIDSTHHTSSYPLPSPTRNELLLWYVHDVTGGGGYIVNYDTVSFPTNQTSFKKITPGYLPTTEWSPDGNLVAQRRSGSITAGYDLYVMQRDGSNLRRMTNGFDISWFSWSPDSKRIVLESYAEGEERNGIFIIDVERSSVKKLTIIP